MTIVSEAENEVVDRARRRDALIFAAATLITSGIAAYTAASMALGSSREATLLPLAIAFGISLTVLALVNFEAFILVVLVSRTALDALKVNSASAVADPAAAVGLLLLVTVPLWLIFQHRSGAMRFRLTRTGVAVAAFTGAAFLGVVVSAAPISSAVEWSRIAAAAAMFFAVEQIALKRGAFRWRSLVAILLAVPVPVAFALVQQATGTGLFEVAGFARVTGSFLHPNPLAAFLVFAIIMALAMVVVMDGRRRRWAIVVVAAATPVLLLTYTRGAWIALFLGALMVAIVLRKAALGVGLAVTLVAAFLLVPSVGERFGTVGEDVLVGTTSQVDQDSLEWRIQYWQDVLTLSDESPVVGIGLKQVAATLPEAKQPHNDFVRAYVELGLLGLVTFLLMSVQFLVLGPRTASRLRRVRDSAAEHRVGLVLAGGFSGVAVAFVTMSLTANLMSQTVILLYVMALAALASAVNVSLKDRPVDVAEGREVA